ncbi:UDP-2,4-diacetamido-2,4,6-trideoxy-beta-L-altropyranose hydrolase [Cohnella sp. CFH 77786]|uniref:UDP-2,4-diacetamido-2,4, 6-trideoxy-beta-L-altropyranose hydrolase n=1 Tax=Cohnella sp. CFH 77786 TaxID=2662265 RepID=UPI001C610C44|nr:UDP-2,4-diacetamido-2,4,6-trideoxy-beta-L-altropyranose hydrolase [Cohnella sp. CFH 77786]MBW5448345.1 UDP-2,4-diacetamido-2,4,6-trideoxy-beta-L-altropyranose hydrolase [Cohnella sp. CFH 77786]
MKVYIRADASRDIGSGHVMRCLTLADRLRARHGADVVFLCREHDGSMIPYIRGRGYEVDAFPRASSPEAEARTETMEEALPAHAHWLGAHWTFDAEQTIEALTKRRGRPEPADWLVVDHYALDRRYEEKVRPYVKKLMVIDDLADRPHLCDVLLDQNLDAETGFRYRDLVEPGTRLLIGPRYALLREEFAESRPLVRRDGSIRRVLISFGGVDRTGETSKTLTALAPLAEAGLEITVLAGGANRDAGKIADLCASLPNVRFHRHAERVAPLMLKADAAIGAGGSSTWERCCLGLPALIVTTAANQETLTERAAQAGAVRWLGRSEEVDPALIREAVLTMRQHSQRVLWMSARAMELTDGLGADRIAKELEP